MLGVHHYSSKAKSQAKKLSAILLAGSLLTGCSLSAPKTGEALDVSSSHLAKAETKADENFNSKVEHQASISRIDYKTKTASLPGVVTNPGDAWCRYIINNTAAEAHIIASPTVSVSTDQDGNNSANIGMNLLDFKKADLIQKSAAAKCRQHKAGKTIEAAIALVNESSKLAAYNAKYTYLKSKTSELNRIRSKTNSHVNVGTLTKQQSNTIKARISLLKSAMGEALAEVEKRKNLPSADNFSLNSKTFELANAETELQNIDRDIRTLDALNISVKAGYNDLDEQFSGNTNNDYYASIKVGVRLGALSPSRSRYEEAASEARIDALNEKNTGIIWKTDFAEKSLTNSLKGLRKAQKEYAVQRDTATDSYKRLRNSDRAEFQNAALQAAIERIGAHANYLALSASINEVEANRIRLNKLKN